jgi:RNA polymerase sigma factor (sigma-70 family)
MGETSSWEFYRIDPGSTSSPPELPEPYAFSPTRQPFSGEYPDKTRPGETAMTAATRLDLSAKLRRAVGPPDDPDASDGRLLARFLADRDDTAFALLVRRHGPMVYGVCRRVIGDHHLTEDAFQAVFLVLARRADAVRPREAVGGFLYGVAYRVALRARTMAGRRGKRETLVAAVPERPAAVEPPAESLERTAILDAEIARLSDPLRTAVVLCELEGRPRADVARQLGIPEGTLSSRLAAARKQLATRLRRHGLVLPAAGLVAAGVVPPPLLAAAVGAVDGPVSPTVTSLASEVFRTMLLKKLRVAMLLAVATAAACGALVVAGSPGSANPPPTPAPVVKPGPNRLLVMTGKGLVLIDPDAPPMTGLGPPLAQALHGTLSPDGRRLAVNEFVPGPQPTTGLPNTRAVVRSLDGKSKDVVIPKLDPTAPVEPLVAVWSPDGKRLLVRQPLVKSNVDGSFDRVSWWLVDPITGKPDPDPVLVPDRHTVVDWSADGTRFLTWTIERPAEKPPTSRLALVPRDGGKPEFVTAEGVQALSGRFSPEGTKLLFSSHRLDGGVSDGRYQLHVMSLKEQKPVRVSDPEKGDVAGLGCCWSPDGRRIAYIRSKPFLDVREENTGCNFAVVVANADGSDPKVVHTRTLMGKHAPSSGGLSLFDWR